MGAGPSKVDYKERDFEEQPLEDEEIDVLLKKLPEEDVIGSLDDEDREKIVRAMSDQKVFNIRGDNIFDYYFTNNKEAIKGCMTSQFTRDETPCPDEKFNRMITRIPDLVQGPLREKETEWDTERSGLQGKYDTLEQEKTELQTHYDTLFDKISHRKVIDSGRIVDNITEEECKKIYKILKGKDFSSVPNTDRPKGCYRSGNHYRYAKNGYLECGKGTDDCIITKPPWSKFRQDMLDHGVGLRNAGGDTDTLSFNKEKFGYLISVLPAKASNWREIKAKGSSWDIGTSVYIFQDAYKHKSFPWFEIYKKMEQYQVGKFTKISFGTPFSTYKDVSSGTPSKNMTEDECKASGKTIKGRVWTSTGSWANDPAGCITDGKKTWFNKNENSHDCGYRGYDCVEKNNVSEQQCKDYAYRTGLKWFGDPGNWDDRPKGCVLHKPTDRVFYNLKDNNKKCSSAFNCIHNSEKYNRKQCGGTIGGDYDCRVGAGWSDVVVSGWDRNKFGTTFEDAKHFCNNSATCVAVAQGGTHWNWPVHTTSKFKPCNEGDICKPDINYYTKDVLPEYYKVTGSGLCDKPEDIVPQDECKQAASALNYNPEETHFGQTGEHAQSGCFMDGTKLYHFDNKWKGANYEKVGTYGGRTYLCKKSTKCVGSKDKNEPYYHDNLNNPGCCDGLNPFEHNGVKYCKKYN